MPTSPPVVSCNKFFAFDEEQRMLFRSLSRGYRSRFQIISGFGRYPGLAGWLAQMVIGLLETWLSDKTAELENITGYDFNEMKK